MISNKKEYDTNYNERDFSKLTPSDSGRINIYLNADLKKEFQEYCKSAGIPMSTLITMLIHKFLHEALFFEKK